MMCPSIWAVWAVYFNLNPFHCKTDLFLWSSVSNLVAAQTKTSCVLMVHYLTHGIMDAPKRAKWFKGPGSTSAMRDPAWNPLEPSKWTYSLYVMLWVHLQQLYHPHRPQTLACWTYFLWLSVHHHTTVSLWMTSTQSKPFHPSTAIHCLHNTNNCVLNNKNNKTIKNKQCGMMF